MIQRFKKQMNPFYFKKGFFLWLVLVVAVAKPASAQDKLLVQQLEQLRVDAKAEVAMPEVGKRIDNYIKIAEQYQNDTIRAIRWNVQRLLFHLYKNTTKSDQHQQIVEQMVKALGDTDSGIAGYTLSKLETVNQAEFSDNSRGLLINIYNNDPTHLGRFCKLIGFVNIPDLLYPMMQLLADPKLSDANRWDILLALARMGHTESINQCIDRAQKVKVNDQVMYNLVPDILFIRPPEAVDFVARIIFSDKKDCTSPNPDYNTSMLCGYRAMEYLAPVVYNFPFKVSASGDIDTKDYKQALMDTRQWLSENLDHIQFKTDIY